MHYTYEYHKILMYVYHIILLSYMAPTYILRYMYAMFQAFVSHVNTMF